LGLNFSDLWLNKKMEVSASYFFNNSRTNAQSSVNRQLFLPGDSSQFYSENNFSQNDNYNHRINGRLEYKIDSNNTLIVSPNISIQKSQNFSEVTGETVSDGKVFINGTRNLRNQSGDGYNVRNDVVYRRAFAKKGRSFSVNLNTSFNRRNNENYLDAFTDVARPGGVVFDTVRQVTNNVNKGYSLGTNLTWSEPLSDKSQLQFNYNPSISKNNADQRNLLFDKDIKDYTILDTALSNLFDNTVRTHRTGLSFRTGDRDKQFNAGIDFQNTLLTSDQTFPQVATVRKTFNNLLPNLMWRSQINKQTNLRLGYRASINTPSVNQLQNVINLSNPLFLSSGNENLNNSYNHFVFSRLSITNTSKGTSMFAGLFLQKVQDFVTNGTWVAAQDSVLANGIVLRRGGQLTKPVNLDGFYSVRGFFNYGFPIKPIKSNVNLTAGANYSRTPGLVNNVENLTNNANYNLGINIGSNISEYIDFNINYSANFNNVKNTIRPELNNRFYFHNAGVKVNLLTKSGFFILNDLNNQRFSGLADGFNQSFWLWNVSAGKKFLKNQRGEVKMTVFDLLRQNQSISRNVADSYIEDVQTVVLQQYFMLTFTYTLRNFGKPAQRSSPERGNLRGRM
ncbi:MAG TPA: outer membrane beta-barrel protein, partial [Phnomibacter sp.]|nr:outer membrane beta-barrel protein [Phnomibacter sp.]